MKKRLLNLFVFSALLAATGCSGNTQKAAPEPEPKVEAKAVPTICVYTLGPVDGRLQRVMLDSLKVHYPMCRLAGNIALPEEARTTKRHDRVRYRADLLNKMLSRYRSDSTLVVGLTQADIGLDNFRNRAHSGIMGMANGIGTGVAVFSSYRPHGYGQLFSVMVHEIGHAQGLRHCSDERCIMQDAKGGNPFSRTNVFCDKCKKFMTDRHWRF